jgi:hypothetical protein
MGEVRSRAREQSWTWRLPVLLWVLWSGLRQLQDPEYRSLFAGILFGVHELGHLVFAAFGQWAAIAGGSFAQLALPAACGLLFLSRREYFGTVVCAAWLSISLTDLARYVADARALDLDLVSFGEQAIHDWNYLLGRAGLLQHDLSIARARRVLATVLLLACGAAGGWLLSLMRWNPAHSPPARR